MQTGDQSLFQKGLHILILFGIAVAYPILQVLTQSVAFFIAGDNQPIDLIFLTVALSVILPLLLVSIVWLAGFWKSAGKYVYFSILFVLLSAILLPALKLFVQWRAVWMLAAVFSVALMFTILYSRNRAFRAAMTLLSPLILVIPILFLTNQRVRKIVWEKPPSIGRVSVRSKTPVVMVLFDEFPLKSLMDQNGNIDAQRYPHFSRFAQKSTWYRNATTVSADTMLAVPAILTGNYPKPFSIANRFDHPRNLFTLFANSPYRLQIYESATRLSPRSEKTPLPGFADRNLLVFSDLSAIYLHHLLPSDLVEGLPVVTETWRGFWRRAPQIAGLNRSRARDKRGEEFLRFVSSIKSSAQPGFYFLHIMLPHVPWQYFPSGRQYNGVGIGSFGIDGYTRTRMWIDSSSAIETSLTRHLMQVEFVDRLIGDLMQHMDREKIFEPALIVFVSDHGASFRAGELRRQITPKNYDEVARIPLFIKKPFQKTGVISDVNAQVVDVLPTLLQELQVQCDWKMDGHSLMDPGIDTKAKTYFTGYRRIQLASESASVVRGFSPSNQAGAIGKPLTSLQDLGKSPIEIHLHNADAFKNVRFHYRPALVTAHLDAQNVKEDATFGIVVNGVIRAVTRPFQFDRKSSRLFLSAVLPEASFQRGRNQVEIIILPREGQFMRLALILEKAQESYD